MTVTISPKALQKVVIQPKQPVIPVRVYYSAGAPDLINDAITSTGKSWSSSKISSELSLKLNKAGDTMTGALITSASAAGGAGLRLPHGAAPSIPTNGDAWTTTAGWFARINGATVQFSVVGHTHTKAEVGLANVDNTSDLNKPISTATQNALDLKLDDSQAGAFGLTLLGTANLAAAKTALALVKGDVGLGNVDNTSDLNKPISTATQAALNAKVDSALIGVANGIVPLDGTTKIAATFLPSYVDDILEFADAASFPATGESGKLYTALDNSRLYRWSGSGYVQIGGPGGTLATDTDGLAEGVVNKYFTNARVYAALTAGVTSTLAMAAGVGQQFLGGQIVGKDTANTVEYGRIFWNVTAGVLRGTKIEFQNVAGAVLATVQANGNFDATGAITAISNSYVKAGAATNSNLWFKDDADLNQGVIFWDRAADAVTMRRYNAAGNAAEGEFSLTSTGATLSYNLTVTGTVIGTGVVIRGGASEGGQITLGYGGGAATTINGQANSSWNIDVDSANALRFFRQGSSGAVVTALKFAEADGEATFGGFASFQTPNVGTTGGIRLRGNQTTGYAYQQITNYDATAEWGFWRYDNAGAAYWNGTLTINGNITSNSDARLKQNIRPLEDGLKLVKGLRGVRYEMRSTPGVERIGVIAQEIEKILPELVEQDQEGVKSVDYSKLTAVLIEAVKSLSARVEELERVIP